MQTGPFTVLVCGGRRFKDRKFIERALNAVYARRIITTLITGNLAGTEEISYWWAAQKPVGTVVTVPHRGFTQIDAINRYRDVFRTYEVCGLILFDGAPCVDWLQDSGDQHRAKIWIVGKLP